MTTPKLPPPPRNAQRSSGFSSSEARTSSPSAVTSSAATQVVAGEAVLALEPAGAAAEGEPADAGGRHAPAGGGEPVGLRGAVDVGPGGPAADARDPPLGVDVDVAHAAQVEHEAVVAERAPGDRVAAGPHGDLQPVLAGEGERGDHVVGRRAARHEPRAPLDHRVEQRAGIGVLRLAGLVEAATQAEAQLLNAVSGSGSSGGGDRHRFFLAFDHAGEATPGAVAGLRLFRPSRRRWPEPARIAVAA